MLNTPFTCSDIPIPEGATLADPRFNESKRIDLLIGAGLFWQLWCIGQHNFGSGLLWQKTHLGCVLRRSLTWPSNQLTINVNMYHSIIDEQLHNTISKIWEIKNVCETTKTLNSLNICEQHFKQNTTYDSKGHFIVWILFNARVQDLDESRMQAEKRLVNIEHKL